MAPEGGKDYFAFSFASCWAAARIRISMFLTRATLARLKRSPRRNFSMFLSLGSRAM